MGTVLAWQSSLQPPEADYFLGFRLQHKIQTQWTNGKASTRHGLRRNHNVQIEELGAVYENPESPVFVGNRSEI
ncbi:hypothetical protein N7504_010771 [Penicillium tannophilum]|nr:hypothetical protein N7504_010771 [Penicillium tannophilum]